MDLRESSRSGMKRDVDDSLDVKGDRVGDEEDLDGGDKRKYRSSKPRKHGNVEEIEERDSSERRKNSGDRTESRKRSGGLSRVGSGDEDEYNTKKESHSKLLKRNQDEKIEKKSSSVYQEKETESSRKSRDVSGSKGYGVADETERESSRKSGSKPPVHETGSKGYGVADETEKESSRKSGSKLPVHETGSKGYGVADETERESSRKSGSKPPVHEVSQSKSRSKLNSSHDIELEMAKDRDSRYAERKESSRDKNHGFRETEKSSKRRWDEPDPDRKGEDSNYVDKPDSRSEKISHIKHGNDRERSSDIRNETVEPKSRIRDSNSDKVIKPSSGEEKLIDGEKTRSRGKPEVYEEDNRPGSVTREDKSGGPREDKLQSVREKPSRFFDDIEPVTHKPITRGHDDKSETHMHQSNPVQGVHDIDESREKSVNRDEDGRARTRDRSGREVRYSRRSWSPERSGRRHPQSYDSGSDNERSNNLKGKERETESYRDDRIRGRDSNWSDKNRERESSKDNWKRRHESNSDKDSAYVVVDFDHDIDWDVQRRDRERNGNDKLHSHPGYRKLGRTESVKSSYGNPNRSSDMIEIRPSSIDFRREESGSVFAGRKSEGAAQTDYTSATGDDQWGYQSDDRMRVDDSHGPGDDPQERYADDGSSVMSQNSGRNYNDMQGEKGRGHMGVTNSNHSGGPNPNSGSQSPFGNNQGSGNFNRMTPQGAKGSRLGRGGRGRPIGRDGPRGMPLPMMGPPFGPLGIPQGPMQTLGPNMSPGHCPPMGLGVFIPPYPGPNVWPGARGVDVNMLSVPHGLSPVPPGPSPPRFPPNVTGPNPAMYFNQQGPARGVSPNMPGPGFNAMGTMGRGMPNDKPLGGWTPRTSGTLGKAPSRGEQNDYSQNFVDTGTRPQNYIRELLELTNTVEDYPKLRELIQRKDEIVAKSASPPMYYKCDLRDFVLSPEFFGTKFDVILVDPPWEEYVHRAPGVADHMDYWTFEEISNLKIEAIADTPSFIFLWVGDGVGLEQGRQCLRKWGFRRCEDICWVKTNKGNSTSGLRHDSHTLFQHSKEHCLMGIKGTVRRSTDGHVIHANIDTDIVIAEEPPYGSTTKPEDLYRIIEHFSLGRRRIELFGEDHNIRSGWMTVGKDLSSSNFNAEAYIRNFCDKDGKVWQGGGGRNPPPGAPHLMVTTPEIEGLRPKSPPPKNQQQPTMSLTQMTTNSANRRPMANSPQTPTPPGINQEASSSHPSTPAQWASSPMVETKTPETTGMATDEKGFDGYGYEAPGGQLNAGHLDFGSQGASNML